MRNFRIISVALAAIAALTVVLGAVFLSAARSVDFVTTGGAISAEATGLTAEEISEILNNGGFTLDENGTLGMPEGYSPGDFTVLWNSIGELHDTLMGRDENGVTDEKKQLLKYIRYTNSLCPSAEEGELIIVLDLSAADITVIGESAFDAFLNIAIGYNAFGIGTSFTEEVAIIDTATGEVLRTEETALTNSSVWNNFSVRIILPPPREGREIYFDDNSLNTQWYSPNAVELDITDSELRKNADGSISGIRLSPQATGTNIWGTAIQPLHLHWITAEDDLTQQEYAFKNGVDFILAGGAGSTAEYDADAEMYVKKGNNGLAVHRSEISRTAGGNSQKSITIYAAENPQTGYADHTDVIDLFNYLYVNYVTQSYPGMFEETDFYHVLLDENNMPSSAAGTVTVDETLDIYCSHRTGGEAIGSITAA